MKVGQIESIIAYLEETEEECLEPERVDVCLKEVENACISATQPAEKAMLLYTMGVAYYKSGETDRAMKYMELALQNAESAGLEVYCAKIHSSLAVCCDVFGDMKMAAKHADIARRDFGRLHLPDELAMHYINMLWARRLASDNDEAMEYLQRAEYYCRGLSNSKSVRIYFCIAEIYKNILQDPIRGTQYLTRGIEICRQNGLPVMELLGLKRLADMYLGMERYPEAKEMYRKVTESGVFDELPASVRAAVLMNLIFCDFHLGRLVDGEKRMETLEELLPQLWEKECRQFTAVAYYMRARLMLVRGEDLGHAEVLLRDAEKIFETFGRRDFPAQEFDFSLCMLEEQIYFRQGRLGSAVKSAHRLEKIAKHYDAMRQREAYERLLELYELKGDYVAACTYAHKIDEAAEAVEAGNLALRFDQMCRKFFDTLRAGELKELSRTKKDLERSIDIDGLTQVYNKKYYLHYLRQLREGERMNIRLLTILMLDIDNFKAYNDRYGHPAGDRCLLRTAQAFVASAAGMEARVMRYGGEEFAIFLENSSEAEGEQLARRILALLAEQHIPHESSPVADHVTVSIGIASERRDIAHQVDAMMERADEALYAAKRDGGNTFRTMHW